MTAAGGRGWWRRNWWGLLALVPVLVTAVALSPNDAYEVWRTAQPREAVGPDRDGWISYGGTRLRLAAVVPADLRDPDTEEPYQLPPGLQAWQATVTFGRLADPDNSLLGCAFLLEDEAGRRFGDHPTELGGAELAGGSIGPTICRPDEPEDDTFEAIALFLLPESTRPAALLLTASDQLPAYARFELDPAALPAG
ncbi:MAG: hypothetical protein GEV12_10805 [Micromonosporaceae bacterium]|nr:hypothetical protein [Micromonosporaceae bacterium]